MVEEDKSGGQTATRAWPTSTGPYQCQMCGAFTMTFDEAKSGYACTGEGGCDRHVGRVWVAWNERHELNVLGDPDPALLPRVRRLVVQGRPVPNAVRDVYHELLVGKDAPFATLTASEEAAVVPYLVRLYDAWVADRTALRNGYFCRACKKDMNEEVAHGVWECLGCKAKTETPTWIAKRRPDGTFDAAEFGTRMVQALLHEMRSGKDPDDVFAATTARRSIPKELWPRLRERIREADQTEDLVVDVGKVIVFGQDGIHLTTDKRNPLVIGGRFRVVRVVTIEGERRAVVEDDMGEFAGTLAEILARLESNGQVLGFRDVKEVLAHLIHRCPEKSTAAATYGVCEESGRLYLPKEFLPKQGDQHDALERVLEHLDHAPTTEEWQAYADFARFFLAREWGPAYAVAAVAPFASVLRRRKQIFPILYQYSREPGTGKSSLMEAMTRGLWNTEVEGAKTLNTDYRFMAYLDMISLPWGFDEAQDFDWDKRGGSLKQAMESEYTERRGQVGNNVVKMVRHRSRLSPIMSANVMRPIPPAVLARVLVVHFLEERTRAPDAVKKQFKAAFGRLTACGPALTRAGLEECEGSLPVLLAQLEAVQEELGRHYADARDNRRLSVWALLYWGLRVWQRATAGAVAAPPLQEFVDQVVRPIEDAGQQATLDPLTKLRSFLSQYVAKNRRGDGNVAGHGEIFARHYMRERRLDGYHLAHPFLDLYNDAVKATPELTIPTLRELATMVARRHRIPEGELLEGTQAPRVQFGDRQVRAVFLPIDEPGQEALPIGNGSHGGNGGGAPPEPPPLAQGERLVWLVGELRDLAKGTPEGVPLEAVVVAARLQGIGEETVREDLATAAGRGYVYMPRQGTVLPY